MQATRDPDSHTKRNGGDEISVAKRLTSVFTDDMDHCIFTGSPIVERHHIFGGASRKHSECFGYVVPLRPDYHPNGTQATEYAMTEIDLQLKQMAQRHFEENHGSREDFILYFGKSYL